MVKLESAKQSQKLRVTLISLVVGVVLLLIKFWAFRVTGSLAIQSDALESIVNVLAAVMAIVVVIQSAKPADKDHPYGHGKIEYFSAAFEGGFIFFAAILIVYESINALWKGSEPQQLEFGLFLVGLAGVVNLGMGLILIRAGKSTHSLALEASGTHLLSDFWTSLGVIAGLMVVQWTGLVWIDSAIAFVVGLHLAWSGWGLLRQATGGLMDEEDEELIEGLADLFNKHAFPGIIHIHHTRVIRSGDYHHIDAHVVVPEFWTVDDAHQQTDRFEAGIIRSHKTKGELHLHLDPCRRSYCSVCDLKDCPVRREEFSKRLKIVREDLVSPLEPEEFRKKGTKPPGGH